MSLFFQMDQSGASPVVRACELSHYHHWYGRQEPKVWWVPCLSRRLPPTLWSGSCFGLTMGNRDDKLQHHLFAWLCSSISCCAGSLEPSHSRQEMASWLRIGFIDACYPAVPLHFTLVRLRVVWTGHQRAQTRAAERKT